MLSRVILSSLMVLLSVVAISFAQSCQSGGGNSLDPSQNGCSPLIVSSIKKSLSELEHRRAAKEVNDAGNETKVCYDDIGCFDAENDAMFAYLGVLPASPESIGTTFWLITSKSPVAQQLLNNDQNILDSNLNPSRDVKVIIHDYGSSRHAVWIPKTVDAFIEAQDCNVLVVDYTAGAKMPDYVQAIANTPLVGAQLAALIKRINSLTTLTPARFHLVGFGLGAHLAGFTGAKVKKIGKITGLDPLGPWFEDRPGEMRLDPSDASYVEVMHSDADGLGTHTSMGHDDFMVNGG